MSKELEDWLMKQIEQVTHPEITRSQRVIHRTVSSFFSKLIEIDDDQVKRKVLARTWKRLKAKGKEPVLALFRDQGLLDVKRNAHLDQDELVVQFATPASDVTGLEIKPQGGQMPLVRVIRWMHQPS